MDHIDHYCTGDELNPRKMRGDRPSILKTSGSLEMLGQLISETRARQSGLLQAICVNFENITFLTDPDVATLRIKVALM